MATFKFFLMYGTIGKAGKSETVHPFIKSSTTFGKSWNFSKKIICWLFKFVQDFSTPMTFWLRVAYVKISVTHSKKVLGYQEMFQNFSSFFFLPRFYLVFTRFYSFFARFLLVFTRFYSFCQTLKPFPPFWNFSKDSTTFQLSVNFQLSVDRTDFLENTPRTFQFLRIRIRVTLILIRVTLFEDFRTF